MKKTTLIGMALGLGAGNAGCADGPQHLHQSSLLKHAKININWQEILRPNQAEKEKLPQIAEFCQEIAKAIIKAMNKDEFFIAVGGDHSCAIGVWGGLANAYQEKGDVGLIWIDAHLDAHTFATTPTGNIHGMPVAVLLGEGEPSLLKIIANKLKPENICYIGIRSFEKGEYELLSRLGVKMYFMDEVRNLGLEYIMEQAIQHVSRNTVGFGISLDLDGFDPNDVPGVGTPVAGGISVQQFLKIFPKLKQDSRWLGLEISEFNPYLDKEQKTEKLIVDLLKILSSN